MKKKHFILNSEVGFSIFRGPFRKISKNLFKI